ncbi:hypothetical protein RsY01_184 [Lactococcus reticulitermitis]|uniref:Uncharacterized protein n=1 Tax=Pseudolactococcus reticulitermitis TaxID=2025039 RepID=A0A224XA47_9LACT|nr:hypothetical protein RsY01_184 [Lactococcus reticulitermitis]
MLDKISLILQIALAGKCFYVGISNRTTDLDKKCLNIQEWFIQYLAL